MPDEASLIRTRPRIGLALGAGVARGWAHIGVIRALKKLGIEPDIVTGTSVGALVGGCYLAGHLDTLEEWTRNLSRMKIVQARSAGFDQLLQVGQDPAIDLWSFGQWHLFNTWIETVGDRVVYEEGVRVP